MYPEITPVLNWQEPTLRVTPRNSYSYKFYESLKKDINTQNIQENTYYVVPENEDQRLKAMFQENSIEKEFKKKEEAGFTYEESLENFRQDNREMELQELHNAYNEMILDEFRDENGELILE